MIFLLFSLSAFALEMPDITGLATNGETVPSMPSGNLDYRELTSEQASQSAWLANHSLQAAARFYDAAQPFLRSSFAFEVAMGNILMNFYQKEMAQAQAAFVSAGEYGSKANRACWGDNDACSDRLSGSADLASISVGSVSTTSSPGYGALQAAAVAGVPGGSAPPAFLTMISPETKAILNSVGLNEATVNQALTQGNVSYNADAKLNSLGLSEEEKARAISQAKEIALAKGISVNELSDLSKGGGDKISGNKVSVGDAGKGTANGSSLSGGQLRQAYGFTEGKGNLTGVFSQRGINGQGRGGTDSKEGDGKGRRIASIAGENGAGGSQDYVEKKFYDKYLAQFFGTKAEDEQEADLGATSRGSGKLTAKMTMAEAGIQSGSKWLNIFQRATLTYRNTAYWSTFYSKIRR